MLREAGHVMEYNKMPGANRQRAGSEAREPEIKKLG